MTCNNTTYIALLNSTEVLNKFYTYQFTYDITNHNAPLAIIVNKSVTPFFFAIGIFGNIISALVWSNPRMHTCVTAAYYLTVLAVADLIFLILHLFFELEYPWLLGSLDLTGWCQVFSVANLSSQYFCVFLVFAFTVERFLSVCHPFKSERFGSRRTPKVIVTLLALSIVLGIPQAYFWKINFVGVCMVRSEETSDLNLSFFSIYTWCTELAIFLVLPLCVMALNIAVLHKIRKSDALNLGKVSSSTFNRRSNGNSQHATGSRCGKKPEDSSALQTTSLIPKDASRLNRGCHFEENSSKLMRPSSPASRRASHNSYHRDSYRRTSPDKEANNQRGTTITLVWVSFFLIGTMLPNTVVYALQSSVPFGPIYCTKEEMGNHPQWKSYFVFITIKSIIREISLSHHVGNVFIYLATSRRFVRLVFQNIIHRSKPCSRDSRETSELTVVRSYNCRRHSGELV